MLKSLTRNFSNIIKKVRGHGRLTEENIAEALADIRTVMLDADVALPIADEFLAAVKEQAEGAQIDRNINPGQAFTNIVHRQLAVVMGGEHSALLLKKSPAVILACGLQGVGKTTNMAKIGKYLKGNKKRVMLGSTDIRRPAALQQLSILAESADVPYIDSTELSDVTARAADILKTARRQLADAVLIDTAGRTALDDEMMDEIRRLSALLQPSETLFFVDAMQGQDAVNVARAFHDAVGITGIVITKMDGDTRGGAALSARAVTGASVKFVGVGEKIDDIQPFHPMRFASRILGMGDIASLAEQAGAVGGKAAQAFNKVLRKPAEFNLNDQLEQLREVTKMGGMSALTDKLPAAFADKLKGADPDFAAVKTMEAVICSMTPSEREHPDIIKASRKRRIAKGAGVEVVQVNQLLLRHNQTRKLMKRFAKNPSGLARLMSGIMQ